MKTFRQLSEIIMPQVKNDLEGMDKMSFVKKHGLTKSAAKQKLATEAKEKTEYDYEGDMARGQLQSIISNAQRVHDMLEDDTNIAEWVQSKITLAEDYISTVANYMMSEVDESVDLDEASSAAVRMQRALDKIKQSREASERRAQELLKPKPKNEEVELDEISKSTLGKYVNKARSDRMDALHSNYRNTDDDYEAAKKDNERVEKRDRGINLARAKINKFGKSGNTIAKVKATEEVELDEVSTDGYHAAAVKSRMSAAVKVMSSMGKDKEAKTKLDARNAGLKRLSDRTSAEMKKANSGPQKSTPSKTPTEAERRGYGQGRYMGDSVEITDNQINEARPSQRHPLEGHEYHKKTDAELVHIAKDAHAAAEAMKSHNTTAENKYRDQANDSATVRHFRKTSGTPDWYKKKYGHMKESFRPMDEPKYSLSIQARQKKADDANKPPFDGPYKKSTGVVTDKSGAKHSGMSIARNLAKQAMKKQAEKMPVKESLEESRKAEIIKEIMKKGKKKENNTFQAEPEITTTVVKADN